MASLIWCRYTKAPGDVSHRLLLELGTKDGLVYALDNKLLGREEITLIRQAYAVLPKMNVDEILEWLIDRVPGAKKALKTYKASQLVVINQYPIKSI